MSKNEHTFSLKISYDCLLLFESLLPLPLSFKRSLKLNVLPECAQCVKALIKSTSKALKEQESN